MKKDIIVTLLAFLLIAGCVPVPKQTTTIVYEAQGKNAVTRTGGDCTGVAYSYYRYNLNDPTLPIPIWRTKPEEVRVQVFPDDSFLEVKYSVLSWEYRKSVKFDPSKIQIRLNGNLVQQMNVSHQNFPNGTSLTLKIDIRKILPELVIIETRSKAILVNNRSFPVPKMIFKRATRTTTMLTQPVNC